MAALPPLKSTTAEAALMELIMYIQILESTPGSNPNGRNYVQGSINNDTQIFSGSYSLPVSQAIDQTDGSSKFQATEYLTTPP